VPAAESVTGGSRLVLPFFTLGVEADFRAARKAHADPITRSAGASKTFATGARNTLPAAVTRSVNKTPRARAALIGTDATSTPRRSRPKATGETHQTV